MRKGLRAISILVGSALLSFSYLNCSGGFKSLDGSAALSSLSTIPGTPTTLPGTPDSSTEALPATSGTPLIHQLRGGVQIATFKNLSSIFMRVGGYRLYATGDIFELDPAIY